MKRRVAQAVVAMVVGVLFGQVALAASPSDVARAPSLDEQFARSRVIRGSALERLIRDNQDFSILRADEFADPRGVPAWLKVQWRRAHPEGRYTASDPTGGYPLVLKEIHEWMMAHQDLRPGVPEAPVPPGFVNFAGGGIGRDMDREEEIEGAALVAPLVGTPGTNVRTSGAQTVPRSESDIRINFLNTSKIIGASNNIGGSGMQAQYYSTDGGATWGQSSLSLFSGDSFHSDPTVDWTSDGRAWSTTLGINSGGTILHGRAYVSANGGQTWSQDGTFSGSQSNVDKQMMWIDHSSSSSFKDNIYVIYHNGNPAFMNRRTASGWGTPIQVSGSETTGTGIGADVKSNSAGDVFGMWPDTGSSAIYVAKSTTGGASYGAPVRITTTFDSYDTGIPSFNSRRMLIYVSGGAYRNGTKNNVYALWADLSGDSGCTAPANEPGSNAASTCKTRVFFSRSLDGGATWSARVKLNNQAGKNDQFNPFLAVDETNGTIGVMYYDTVADAARLKSDVWYQSSTDDGATWSSAVKVTTAQTDETAAGADSGNQYGDYNSLSGYAGAFFPSWTDRRSGSKEEIWTAKVTEGGGPTTFSVSGSAGTSGATVTAGSGSATSDASNNYSISGLVAGTYTVTPSKSGCTFSPTSRSVTLGPNATGVNFTATCGGGSQQLLGNPDFESGNTVWTATSGVIDNSASEPAHSGSWKAWLNGYGSTHTDSCYQQVTIASTATSATLSFWLHIDTAETTTTTAFDKLQVQIRNSANTVLATLATYSNLNKATGYSQKTFDVTAYKGQTIRVYFLGTEDSSLQTSFVIDDTALNVQ